MVFLIPSQLDSLCTCTVKQYYAKAEKQQFTVHISPVFNDKAAAMSKNDLKGHIHAGSASS